jgi:hypothetical protein
MTFLGDEGRDALVLLRLFRNFDIPFLGPTASVGGFFLGPFYYYLIAPFFVGILGKTKGYMLHSILGSAILYLLIFQGGNVQHEYYQILILPALALFVGLGVHYIYENRSALVSPMLAYPVILVFFLFSFFFSYYRIKDYYNVPLDLVQISNIIVTLIIFFRNSKFIYRNFFYLYVIICTHIEKNFMPIS